MSKNKKSQLSLFQTTVGCWANAKFPKSDNKALCEHLRREVVELSEQWSPDEAADCLLLLLHLAHKNNFDLLEEAIKKQKINLKRKWATVPDERGIYRHI